MNQENRNYLDDCFSFVRLFLGPREDSCPRTLKSSEWETLKEIRADIRKRAQEAVQKGADIRMEKLIKKHKLDDGEAMILWALVFAAVYGREELYRADNLRKFIAYDKADEHIAAMKYLYPQSNLLKKKIVTLNEHNYVGKYFVLEDEILRYILEEKSPKTRSKSSRLSASAIYEKLSRYASGQEKARQALSIAAFKHFQVSKLNKKKKGLDRIQKTNILMIGPTGSGKTHLCKALAAVLDVPIAFCDATQYTKTGYVGFNVDGMLHDLYEKANHDMNRAEQGIIYIDEIDKIAHKNSNGRDIAGLSVQQELLKMLDGEIVVSGRKSFDVSGILFIVSGAFSGLEDIIKARIQKRGIGFLNERNAKNDANILSQVSTEDLQAYGFMPEFIGRFADFIVLNSLEKEDLVNIMTKPKNNLISQYQAVFEASGINLRIPPASIEWVAEQALKNKTGARGLKRILESNLSPFLFNREPGERQNEPEEIIFEPEDERFVSKLDFLENGTNA